MHKKKRSALLSQNILLEKTYLALQQCENNEFTYLNIEHILNGNKLSIVRENDEREYRLTELAFLDIHEILGTKAKQGNMEDGVSSLMKIEGHLKGLSKIQSYMPLSRFLPKDDRVNTDTVYYTRNKEYYIIFKKSEDDIIDVLTFHQTDINFEEAKKRKIELSRND